MDEKKNYNPELEDEFYDDEYLEDIEYVQAPTIKELEKKVRKKIEDFEKKVRKEIEDYGTIEQNPFWDDQTKQWTQMILYYSYGSEESEG